MLRVLREMLYNYISLYLVSPVGTEPGTSGQLPYHNNTSRDKCNPGLSAGIPGIFIQS